MKLPRDLSGSEIIRALRRMDFEVVRQEGSHVRLTRGTCRVTVPAHRAVTVKTLASILAQAHITIDELKQHL